jgi:uncharacterized protein (TIGR02996 family)
LLFGVGEITLYCMDASRFLAAIRAGHSAYCLVLADWLDERGECNRARLVRTRWRRYLRDYAAAVQYEEDPWLRRAREYVRAIDPGVPFERCHGGRSAPQYETFLLVQYIERTLRQAGILSPPPLRAGVAP